MDMNSRFDRYVEELFRQEVSANTITLHYTVKDPESYGIQNPPVSCGYAGTDSALICTSAENALASLHQFKRNKLSDYNKLTYDILEHSYTSSLERGRIFYMKNLSHHLPVLRHSFLFFCQNIVFIILTILTLT